MKRILILSSSGGAGHVRAGQALEAAAKERWPGVEAVHQDALELCGRATRTIVADLYLKVVNLAPSLYGFLYKRSDREMSKRTKAIVGRYDRLFYRALAARVRAFDPDEILCTHFLPAHVMVAKRAKEKFRARISVVLTDYDAHYYWIDAGIDRYFAGSDEVRFLLQTRGIPPDRIRVTGIPIHPVFGRARGRETVARELGVRPDLPTVLVMSGGFGVGKVEDTLRRLLAVPGGAQFLVIAGRNEDLKKRLDAVAESSGGRAKAFGFVTNIQDLMEASDLAVTKAGGLTVTECLAKNLPMLVFNPIPGQEETNADFLAENGAAAKVRSLDLLAYRLERLLADPARLAAMKQAAKGLARPSAAFDILSAILAP